tara:strand:- start:154 stop:783 length:630 start_codon:yes stop_codon:yes gene_type:complete
MDSFQYSKRIAFSSLVLFNFERYHPSGLFKEAAYSYAIVEYVKWKQQKKKQIYEDVHYHVALWNALGHNEKKMYLSPDQFMQKYRCFCILESTESFLDYVEEHIPSICPMWKAKQYSDLYLEWKLFSTPCIQIINELQNLSFEFDFLKNCHLTSFEKKKYNYIQKRVGRLRTSLRKRSEPIELFMKIFYLGNATCINHYDIRRSIYDFL